MADKRKAKVLSAKKQTIQEKHETIAKAIKARKGKVFVYTSKRKLIPIRKTKDLRTSKALKEDKAYWKEKGLMPVPFDPEGFLFYYESNIYFMRTVDQAAQDIAGQGYQLNPREDLKDDWEKNEKIKAFKEKVEHFLSHPNRSGHSLEEIIRRLMIDFGAVGWLNMEVVRNNVGEAGEINHVPAYTVKVHESEKKYCQTRYSKGKRRRSWFKRFGEEEDILVETGEPTTKAKEVKDDKIANEMIKKDNYYIQSDYYGTPNVLGALGAIVAMIGIRDFNIAFFENYGVPAALVILTGDWEEGSDEEVMQFIDNEIKGSENAHKTLALQTPLSDEGKEGKVEWIPLITEVKEGSFMKDYYVHMRNEILVSYSMPPYRIGIAEQGSLGGTTAPESTKIYINSIVITNQKLIESIFNNMILPTFWEEEEEGEEKNPEPIPFTFKLKLPDIRNVKEELQNAILLFDRGSLRIDELRAVNNLPALGKDEGGEERFRKNIYIRFEEEALEKGTSELLQLVHDIESRMEELKA